MSNTTRLKLPYILASQAQKEITHNEALEIIDVLLHAASVTIGDAVPPDSPKPGDCHIVGELPEGVWINHPNALAYYTNGWNFIEACEGMTVWVRKMRSHYIYDGTRWAPSFSTGSSSYPRLTQNATPDVDEHAELNKKETALPVAIVPQDKCIEGKVGQHSKDKEEL